MNTGAPWPELELAEARVRVMQRKLHRWAADDPGRLFDDLFNLVYDPAFLVVALSRVSRNKGARTAVSMGSLRGRSTPVPGSSSRA